MDNIPPMPRGQPQIDVSFDVDSNGILNVSAVEKSTGKAEQITITNDSGRLSESDIERMVSEAEKFKAQDDAMKLKIESRGKLENYVLSTKSTMGDEKLKEKIPSDKMDEINDALSETEKWLTEHFDEECSIYEEKMKSFYV